MGLAEKCRQNCLYSLLYKQQSQQNMQAEPLAALSPLRPELLLSTAVHWLEFMKKRTAYRVLNNMV